MGSKPALGPSGCDSRITHLGVVGIFSPSLVLYFVGRRARGGSIYSDLVRKRACISHESLVGQEYNSGIQVCGVHEFAVTVEQESVVLRIIGNGFGTH